MTDRNTPIIYGVRMRGETMPTVIVGDYLTAERTVRQMVGPGCIVWRHVGADTEWAEVDEDISQITFSREVEKDIHFTGGEHDDVYVEQHDDEDTMSKDLFHLTYEETVRLGRWIERRRAHTTPLKITPPPMRGS